MAVRPQTVATLASKFDSLGQNKVNNFKTYLKNHENQLISAPSQPFNLKRHVTTWLPTKDQSIRLQRRLYGINLVCFLIFEIPCNCIRDDSTELTLSVSLYLRFPATVSDTTVRN